MTYDRKAAPKVGAAEWKAVSKAKRARAKARKAWKDAQEKCVLFVVESATEQHPSVKLAALRYDLLTTGEASIAAEEAYEKAYNAWLHAMSVAGETRPLGEQPRIDLRGTRVSDPFGIASWDKMTEAEQAQAKSRVILARGDA